MPLSLTALTSSPSPVAAALLPTSSPALSPRSPSPPPLPLPTYLAPFAASSPHPINEFEFFFESIGLPPSHPALPSCALFLFNDPHLLAAVSALAHFTFPWTHLGLLYRENTSIFSTPPAVLAPPRRWSVVLAKEGVEGGGAHVLRERAGGRSGGGGGKASGGGGCGRRGCTLY